MNKNIQVENRWGRGLRQLLLAGLMLLALARAPYAAVHLDFARDLFVAWRFLQGEETPLAGPVLAATIHLGPAWYWLLAALLAVLRSWLGVVLALGLLSALQYPLAYLAGKTLHSRRAGLLWAVMLALPAWSSFEWMLPQHYVLTAPLVLAVLLCALRWRQRQGTSYLVGMALSLVLAVHAHPSSIGLLWIVLAVLAAALARRQVQPGPLLLAAVVSLLPLLPYLWWSWHNGFADFRAGGGYLMDGQSTGSLWRVGAVLYASVLGGTGYWLNTLLQAPEWLQRAVMGALVLSFALAAGALLRLRRAPVSAWQVLALIAAVALTTALIRSATTYYMTTPLRCTALGGVAVGLALLGESRWAALLRTGLAVLVLALQSAVAVATGRYLASGSWPFNFQALFDVASPGTEPMRLPLLPSYAMQASGEFLCTQPALAAHGVYARHLLYDYALEMRLHCGRADVLAGGADAQRAHWLGLSRTVARQAGRAATQRLGPLHLFPVRRVLNGEAIRMPDRPLYPVHLPVTNERTTRRFVLEFNAGEHVAVSEMAFFIAPAEVGFRAEGRSFVQQAGDGVVRVFGCGDCRPGETVTVELSITTTTLADTDVVLF